MDEFLILLPDLLYLVFFGWFIVLFFISIKKCFWKGDKSRVKLFFLTLAANPFVSYLTSLFFSAFLLYYAAPILGIDYKTSIFNWYMVTSVASVMAGTMYILVILLFSRIIGKWLGTPNVSLVYFVTIMFGVIFASSLLNDVRESGSSLNLLYIFDLLKPVILFITALLLYRLVIKSLSELTNKEKKTDSNLFIIPPTLFSMLYSISAFLLGVSDEIETTGNIIINIFTFAILFLFIWAFYVIIKNINATNEAIEAKELAAEMARMEAKIEADLSVAKSIQSSALPSVFPPFPDHKGFELFASMSAAKEVGGDFYDFYMLSDSNIGFLIADVSGKSIPGAMFMMTAKTVIKSLAESGLDPAEVFTRANERLCEGNDAEMFVTAWLGYLDLKTGMIRVANAGHNPPVLIRDGKAEYVILKPGLMLAGMDGIRYKEQTLQLRKGDILYLYTDGVTEAMDKDEEQYGEDRLQKLLSFGENYPEPSGENGIAGAVCDMVVADVTKYTADAEQSDDITMLCIRYLGVD